MAYIHPYNPAYPDGATTPADTIDTVIQNVVGMFVERLEQQFGFDFADDPIVLTKLGTVIQFTGKQTFEPEYDAGNSGAAKTLDWVTNGTTQKLTLTANCVITAAVPPAGTRFLVRVVQNATGGWSITWPANYNFQANIIPPYLTTALKATLWFGYSDGSVVYLSLAGTAFDVS